MRRNTFLLLTLSIFSLNLQAQTHDVQIKLKSMQVQKSQEKSGDELYISITEFPKGKRPQNFQVPQFPSHWLSNHLEKFQEVTLWQHKMKECEPMDLLISLVEKDMQPWDIDDSLGSIKLRLHCDQGKLRTEWIPLNSKAQSIPKSKDTFNFTGDESQYRLQFSVEDTPISAPNRSSP